MNQSTFAGMPARKHGQAWIIRIGGNGRDLQEFPAPATQRDKKCPHKTKDRMWVRH
jgi:hypothetical protein